MRPDQLPLDDRHFTPDCDFRLLYENIATNLHAVVHFKRLGQDAKDIRRAIKRRARIAGTILPNEILEREVRCRVKSFDHIVIAVSNSGACYIGTSRTNVVEGDRYNKRFGFRYAVKRAFQNMARGCAVDFEIGLEPPTGALLNDLVSVKMRQFGI